MAVPFAEIVEGIQETRVRMELVGMVRGAL